MEAEDNTKLRRRHSEPVDIPQNLDPSPPTALIPPPSQVRMWREPKYDELVRLKNTLATVLALTIIFGVGGSLWYLLSSTISMPITP
ncbi:hypothetical protein B0T21DRAFT_408901 [Apiosordaria backusii]|uniref:Uncharacterized protein n=1 Tax=Apiosordaria backusii TaxID=314023 RepID=A0AA40EMI4_9PEZI|nr:hypothetical protein B0T21DRAFT_408901 [Apiosordaria backusii]